MARPASKQPTDGELELLKILWEAGPSELGTVVAAQRQARPVATTTVATMLKVMLEKRLVTRRKGRRGYLWTAKVTEKATTRGLLSKLLDRAFDGSAHRLVAHLVEDGKLSEQDRAAIRRLLEVTDDDANEKGTRS